MTHGVSLTVFTNSRINTLLEAPIRAVLKFKTNVRCNYEIAAKIRQSGPGTGSLVGRNTVIDDGVGCEETTSSLLHQE